MKRLTNGDENEGYINEQYQMVLRKKSRNKAITAKQTKGKTKEKNV